MSACSRAGSGSYVYVFSTGDCIRQAVQKHGLPLDTVKSHLRRSRHTPSSLTFNVQMVGEVVV